MTIKKKVVAKTTLKTKKPMATAKKPRVPGKKVVKKPLPAKKIVKKPAPAVKKPAPKVSKLYSVTITGGKRKLQKVASVKVHAAGISVEHVLPRTNILRKDFFLHSDVFSFDDNGAMLKEGGELYFFDDVKSIAVEGAATILTFADDATLSVNLGPNDKLAATVPSTTVVDNEEEVEDDGEQDADEDGEQEGEDDADEDGEQEGEDDGEQDADEEVEQEGEDDADEDADEEGEDEDGDNW